MRHPYGLFGVYHVRPRVIIGIFLERLSHIWRRMLGSSYSKVWWYNGVFIGSEMVCINSSSWVNVCLLCVCLRIVSWMIWHMINTYLGGPLSTWFHMVKVHVLVLLIHDWDISLVNCVWLLCFIVRGTSLWWLAHVWGIYLVYDIDFYGACLRHIVETLAYDLLYGICLRHILDTLDYIFGTWCMAWLRHIMSDMVYGWGTCYGTGFGTWLIHFMVQILVHTHRLISYSDRNNGSYRLMWQWQVDVTVIKIGWCDNDSDSDRLLY